MRAAGIPVHVVELVHPYSEGVRLRAKSFRFEMPVGTRIGRPARAIATVCRRLEDVFDRVSHG
jgi:hypothetical protein